MFGWIQKLLGTKRGYEIKNWTPYLLASRKRGRFKESDYLKSQRSGQVHMTLELLKDEK